uniref:START domain-containing protein n=1 Tax=Globisporangium ultimum (strain ATCC 200006 / CBS 805.95 / DAOM BR144) TaxID=431595 RepID=K3WAG6_GLOUD
MDSVHHARFPLNTAKRPKLLDVDRETVNWWKQSARQEITNLLRDRKSWFYKGKSTEEHEDLKLTYAKHDVRGYTSTGSTGAQASALSRKTNFFCEGILNLSLEDVAYGLYSAETEDQRAVNIYAFQENFLDAAVLDVYERQTMEDPFHFAGIKWVAYVIPPGLVAPADMLYFEYSCKARDADGNVVLVQYITSPELLPHQLHEHNVGLARAKVSQISTFRFLEE